MKKTLRIISIVLLIIILGFSTVFFIYTRNPYQVSVEQIAELELIDKESLTIKEYNRYNTYKVSNPKANIIFVPGGLVEPESYEYFVVNLALEGYNVTLFKPYFNLAMLSPNVFEEYLDKDLDNIIIGHSLGGVTSSIFASNNDEIDDIIFLGSYPVKDVSNKETLIILAENDLLTDEEEVNNSLILAEEDTKIITIEGGNHSQFGWYGHQEGDGEASITTKEQQLETIHIIVEFLNDNET